MLSVRRTSHMGALFTCMYACSVLSGPFDRTATHPGHIARSPPAAVACGARARCCDTPHIAQHTFCARETSASCADPSACEVPWHDLAFGHSDFRPPLSLHHPRPIARCRRRHSPVRQPVRHMGRALGQLHKDVEPWLGLVTPLMINEPPLIQQRKERFELRPNEKGHRAEEHRGEAPGVRCTVNRSERSESVVLENSRFSSTQSRVSRRCGAANRTPPMLRLVRACKPKTLFDGDDDEVESPDARASPASGRRGCQPPRAPVCFGRRCADAGSSSAGNKRLAVAGASARRTAPAGRRCCRRFAAARSAAASQDDRRRTLRDALVLP